MNIASLSDSERQFAADNHGLVYSFLNSRGLDEDEYYDVVVFGYLQAVQNYAKRNELHRYAFSTIAWQRMFRSVSLYWKQQLRKKRNAYTISLESLVFGDEVVSLYEAVSSDESLTANIEEQMIWHDLADRVSKNQLRVLRQKADGYNVREIARRENMTMKGVNELLSASRDAVYEICCR